MDHENIDIVFKDQIDLADHIPLKTNWNKDNSWERLSEKRNWMRYKKIIAVAAVFIPLIILSSILLFHALKTKEPDYSANPLVEYQKRQKLKMIESRMSGHNETFMLCYDCQEFYIVKKKEKIDLFEKSY